MKFSNYALSEELQKAVEQMGFEEATEIQQQAIPILLEDDVDFIGQAQTGTGKTAAFGLPILQKVNTHSRYPESIILAPTRELCRQITAELKTLSRFKRVHIVSVYGGQNIDVQLRALQRPVQIVVGTPGRVLDHINRGTLNLSHVRYTVLDEADVMLDMGFIEDIRKILRATNKYTKIWLFSATIPHEIRALSKEYMTDPIEVNLNEENSATDNAEQHFYVVKEGKKFEALCRILDSLPDIYGLIFCETKLTVKSITLRLKRRGFRVDCLHGDLKQYKRDRVMADFKERRLNLLVATDVAARGIDINSLAYVINYDISKDSKTHVHRVGRTGRVDKRGIAITIVEPQDVRLIRLYAKKTGSKMIYKEVPSSEIVKKRNVQKIIDDLKHVEPDFNILSLIPTEFMDSLNNKELLARVMALLLKRSHSLHSENLNFYENGYKEPPSRSRFRPQNRVPRRRSYFSGSRRR